MGRLTEMDRVRQRKRESVCIRERDTQRKTDRQTQRENVCVCMCLSACLPVFICIYFILAMVNDL